MQGLIETALSNPWATLDRLLDGPLHPGGRESTERLLDRARVDGGTRLLDAGCGPGEAVEAARERGVEPVGVDLDPPAGGVRGDLAALPIRTDAVDVVLAECVLCLLSERGAVFGEFDRVLAPGGRLAVSDVVVEDSAPDLPDPVLEVLCLTNATDRASFVAEIERAGFTVESTTDHHDDLLAMRDEVTSKVDYEAMLGLMGDRGARISGYLDSLETAVENGEISYVSLVASRGGE
ncbi:methyltransferase domain-containing protein [Halovenus sp. WSH3]|uniref:Methyltransferase domain-containing protein n=1 Tax=Halovenus carboxidivorans TaxID=2692199 RepID=A0A6B0T068_9EURY|nr:methyltransferase domain-containing protein [Halovenus carboxidivorans]MXR51538.1 methyltransferase domain-containing protein [Halovenus carboxidivorans]